MSIQSAVSGYHTPRSTEGGNVIHPDVSPSVRPSVGLSTRFLELVLIKLFVKFIWYLIFNLLVCFSWPLFILVFYLWWPNTDPQFIWYLAFIFMGWVFWLLFIFVFLLLILALCCPNMCPKMEKYYYRQTSNIMRASVGNKITQV